MHQTQISTLIPKINNKSPPSIQLALPRLAAVWRGRDESRAALQALRGRAAGAAEVAEGRVLRGWAIFNFSWLLARATAIKSSQMRKEVGQKEWMARGGWERRRREEGGRVTEADYF